MIKKNTMDEGYDAGYRACKCFWGRSPGTIIKLLDTFITDYSGLRALDVGCGDGRNAAYLSTRGASVRALDISELAIANAKANWPDVESVAWEIADIRNVHLEPRDYDIVIASGVMHCFADPEEIFSTVTKLQHATRVGGYHALSSFNSRFQDLSAQPDFTPCLLEHTQYIDLYKGWKLMHASDTDIRESHPHNNIPHTHSATRLIAKLKKALLNQLTNY
ncbi:TPA: class I SAM-dependent methyltransferase [Candidatus Poribacteria bacterium]|nr:class I SAM-dependent methyltransferase [Candidatus Poribacteria bacterium]